jgi:hypothetical protein
VSSLGPPACFFRSVPGPPDHPFAYNDPARSLSPDPPAPVRSLRVPVAPYPPSPSAAQAGPSADRAGPSADRAGPSTDRAGPSAAHLDSCHPDIECRTFDIERHFQNFDIKGCTFNIAPLISGYKDIKGPSFVIEGWQGFRWLFAYGGIF